MPVLPNCFPILNLDWFLNIQAQVGACKTLEELQALVDDVFAEISLLESNIQSQIDALTKINILLTIPGANLTDIITWITGVINDVLTPLAKPLITLLAQIAEITAQVAALTASIESAASKLGITITIPTISIICKL